MKKRNFFFIFTLLGFAFFQNGKAFQVPDYAYADYFQRVLDSAVGLRERVGEVSPKIMVVLTCGIEGPLEILSDKKEIASSDIPYFPVARANGHEGKLIFGKLNGVDVVVLKGRFHYYEGLAPQDVTFPYFVLAQLGVKFLITVNAVGGIRKDLNVGDIMMVTDHINALSNNPLRGIAVQAANQFTDMTEPYSHELHNIAQEVADEQNIKISRGTYLATMGPSYETKSEIKAFRHWGADAVGMSTVFEVIACNFLGIKVLAFSAVANPAADRHESKMNHEEVQEAMTAMAPKLSSLINGCIEKIISVYP